MVAEVPFGCRRICCRFLFMIGKMLTVRDQLENVYSLSPHAPSGVLGGHSFMCFFLSLALHLDLWFVSLTQAFNHSTTISTYRPPLKRFLCSNNAELFGQSGASYNTEN